MLKPALLILTLIADGDIRMTLSAAEDMDECEATLDVVTQILTEAGNPPLLTRCGETALTLTPFEHGTPPEAEVHRYRIEVSADAGFSIVPLSADDECEPAPDAAPAIYCTRSAQQVVSGQ